MLLEMWYVSRGCDESGPQLLEVHSLTCCDHNTSRTSRDGASSRLVSSLEPTSTRSVDLG